MKLRAVGSNDGDALHVIITEPGVAEHLFDGASPDRDASQGHVDAAVLLRRDAIVATFGREGGPSALLVFRPQEALRRSGT